MEKNLPETVVTSSSALPELDLHQTIPHRFEQVVNAYPHHLALMGDRQHWTYQTLNQRVNQIAHAIIAHTGGDRRCVTCLSEHSPAMVMAALGILKAGKIYVAIHPKLPLSAQQNIAQDAQPELLITTARLERQAIEIAQGQYPVLVLEQIHATPSAYPDHPPVVSIRPEDPAIVFYTSGTTGQPKGVVKSHKTILHRVMLCLEQDAIAPGDRQSLLTHSSFASSEADTFGALLNGATLCLFDLISQGFNEFCVWLEAEQITVLHPPVLLFRRFLSMLQGENLFPQVRLVTLAGDTVLPTDIVKWQRHFAPSCQLKQRFSATETGILTVATITHDTVISPRAMLWGFPVTDKDLFLVDTTGQAVPIGSEGELIVKSAYIATGYWSKPEATAAAFKQDPIDPNGRIYRTGDFGEFQPDGRFRYIGRRDHQVKIRGYRVDLREIESVLAQFPEIAETAVIAEQVTEEFKLFAFIVFKSGHELSAQDLSQRLRAVLPEWKIPGRFTTLDSLPTTTNGKVDRQNLLRSLDETLDQMDGALPVPKTDVIDPRDAIELELATIWCEVLGLSQISVFDNFLVLGGHSLAAMQIVSRISDRLQVKLLISSLFTHLTIAELALEIRRLH